MRLTTEREQVRTVAKRWRSAYAYGYWKKDKEKQDILARLEALNVEVATAGDVAAIIGNGSWVEPFTCDECEARSWDVVLLGDEPDHDARYVHACKKCLRKALRLASGIPTPSPAPTEKKE